MSFSQEFEIESLPPQVNFASQSFSNTFCQTWDLAQMKGWKIQKQFGSLYVTPPVGHPAYDWDRLFFVVYCDGIPYNVPDWYTDFFSVPSQMYGQQGQGFQPLSQSYGQQGQGLQPLSQSYGQQGQGFQPLSQSYGQQGLPYQQNLQAFSQQTLPELPFNPQDLQYL